MKFLEGRRIFNGPATEKLGELLPAMTPRKALMMRESERELPNSGLIFIPIIIAVIARTAGEGGREGGCEI